MNATIEQKVKEIDLGVYQVFTCVYDDYGTLIVEQERTFERSNEPFASYKALQFVASQASKFGVTSCTVKTDAESVAKELAGEPHPNARLLQLTVEKFERFGIKIENE